MGKVNPWPSVRQLFETDDGSLPDIYVENLTNDQIVSVYDLVMSQCSIAGNPTAWSKADEKDTLLSNVVSPALEFISGRIESFRHGLAGLHIDGILLPPLTICVEDDGVSFDYRMGSGWNQQTVAALFEVLRQIVRKFPHVRIVRCDESGRGSPDLVFSESLMAYHAGRALP